MGRVKRVNLTGADNPEGRIDVARALGSTGTAMYVYDLAPGQGACPYHYEYEEEWLLIVEGSVVVRTPEGVQTLEQGDLAHFQAGPAGAHKVMNRSDAPARTLMFSRAQTPSVSVYPDSDKIGVWSGDEANDLVFRRGSAVPWSDGEDGWYRAG